MNVARAGIVDIRRDRGGARCGTDGAGHKAGFLGRGEFLTRRLSDSRGGQIHIPRQLWQVIVVLRNSGGTEGIGLHDVGTRAQILIVNLGDHIRPCQGQQFIVAFYINALNHRLRNRIADMICKPMHRSAAILIFRELVLLDHGARGTIEHQNAFGQPCTQLGKCGGFRQRLGHGNKNGDRRSPVWAQWFDRPLF